MPARILLAAYFSFMILISGCQEEGKPPKLVNKIKQQQADQIKSNIVSYCEQCDSPFTDVYFTPRDIVIARHPGIEQDLYLAVLDDEGVPVTCCKKPMRLKVDANGKLFLYCKTCGKLKPVTVIDNKVVVVEVPNSY
jgi:hypothetical protein